jgi:hypothetical protein
MSQPTIFQNWNETTSRLWGEHPTKLAHGLDRSPLFSMDALAALIDAYPRSGYALVETGGMSDKRLWREGDKGDLSGAEVIEAIRTGRMWLNLRNVGGVDARYKAIVDQIFAELSDRIPGFDAPIRSGGLLISSPGAQVYYHADLPGQCLWQLVGRKRVYVYPNKRPFVSERDLEDIALFDMELDLPYQPWFDEHATVLELEPGQMLTWPLNAPHRVENHDCLNVSLTISYSTDEIRRAMSVNMANGILRHKFGMRAPERALSGPTFMAKKVLQRVMRDAGWIKTARAAKRPITFTLERPAPATREMADAA